MKDSQLFMLLRIIISIFSAFVEAKIKFYKRMKFEGYGAYCEKFSAE